MVGKLAEYTKGIKIKTINGKFGEFMTVGINIEEFKNNPINERGYVNFKLSKSRSGEWYAVNDNQVISNNEQNSSPQNNENINTNNNSDSDYLDDTELPF